MAVVDLFNLWNELSFDYWGLGRCTCPAVCNEHVCVICAFVFRVLFDVSLLCDREKSQDWGSHLFPICATSQLGVKELMHPTVWQAKNVTCYQMLQIFMQSLQCFHHIRQESNLCFMCLSYSPSFFLWLVSLFVGLFLSLSSTITSGIA